MFCPKCRNEIRDDATFCSACGAKIEAGQNPQQPVSGAAPYQAQNSYSQAAAGVTLNSMPPATVNPAAVAMFTVKKNGIAVELDGVWGEKLFMYTDPQAMQDDCNKLYAALQELTRSAVMLFKSEGVPVVPLYRMKNIYLNDWWKRLEIDIEGAGKKWFQYPDKQSLHADHEILMGMMQNGR